MNQFLYAMLEKCLTLFGEEEKTGRFASFFLLLFKEKSLDWIGILKQQGSVIEETFRGMSMTIGKHPRFCLKY